ncbi:MAG: hypothetical protein FWD03_03935 [Defluviitaleaceae bacterium]|nr:hypothetical protein [Defluviitaleaceae bacterium]
MEGIIEAILDMEQKAEAALSAVQKEKDRLPARIAAETAHVQQRIDREMNLAIQKMREESEAATAARIQTIQEDGARQLADVEADFNQRRDALRSQLLTRLTSWTT